MTPWQTALAGVLTVLLMVGMGASLSPDAARNTSRRGLLLGAAVQYAWLPLTAAMLGRSLPPEHAISLVLMASVGGGNASNMLTYLARGDVALSLGMTAVTTVLGVVMTPLMLSLYASATGVALPLGAIVLTLTMMAVPVPFGMWLRQRHPVRAAQVDRVGKAAGVLLLLVLVGTSITTHLTTMGEASSALWGAILGVVLSGMAVGALSARLAGLRGDQQLTVGLEIGVQNLPVALAILAASFPAEQQEALQEVPLLYSATALALGGLWVGLRRMVDRA